jgi:hypothetical protein
MRQTVDRVFETYRRSLLRQHGIDDTPEDALEASASSLLNFGVAIF